MRKMYKYYKKNYTFYVYLTYVKCAIHLGIKRGKSRWNLTYFLQVLSNVWVSVYWKVFMQNHSEIINPPFYVGAVSPIRINHIHIPHLRKYQRSVFLLQVYWYAILKNTTRGYFCVRLIPKMKNYEFRLIVRYETYLSRLLCSFIKVMSFMQKKLYGILE